MSQVCVKLNKEGIDKTLLNSIEFKHRQGGLSKQRNKSVFQRSPPLGVFFRLENSKSLLLRELLGFGMANPHSKTLGNFEPTPSYSSTYQLLWPLQLVLNQTSLSRSSWLAGVKSGKFPQPVRISERRVAWRSNDIHTLVESFAYEQSYAQLPQPAIDSSPSVNSSLTTTAKNRGFK